MDSELKKHSGTLLAISADPVEKSQAVVDKNHLPFPILADPQCRVIRAFGVLHEKGGPSGDDIAMPAHFLFQRGGELKWQYVSRRAADRPPVNEVLAAIAALPG